MSLSLRLRRATLASSVLVLSLPGLVGCEGMANFMEEMSAQQEAARLAEEERLEREGPAPAPAPAPTPVAAATPKPAPKPAAPKPAAAPWQPDVREESTQSELRCRYIGTSARGSGIVVHVEIVNEGEQPRRISFTDVNPVMEDMADRSTATTRRETLTGGTATRVRVNGGSIERYATIAAGEAIDLDIEYGDVPPGDGWFYGAQFWMHDTKFQRVGVVRFMPLRMNGGGLQKDRDVKRTKQ